MRFGQPAYGSSPWTGESGKALGPFLQEICHDSHGQRLLVFRGDTGVDAGARSWMLMESPAAVVSSSAAGRTHFSSLGSVTFLDSKLSSTRRITKAATSDSIRLTA